jgi:hypothetical protein
VNEEGQEPTSDDFGTLFGTSADLAALALAAYTIVVTVRSSPGLAPQADYSLGMAQKVLSIATPVLLVSSWLMLIQRADEKGVRIVDLFTNFKSYYSLVFWGIVLIFVGFLFLASSGIT